MADIQQATVNDLPVIRQLAYEIWPAAYGDILSDAQLNYMLEKMYSLPSLQHQLLNLKHSFIIISENNTAIGFASFSAHQENPRIFHLNKIYVHPSKHGKSFGKQILNHVISEIKLLGATSLQLNVNRNNAALHFYKKQGFSILREEDIDIGKGFFMNDFVMEKKL